MDSNDKDLDRLKTSKSSHFKSTMKISSTLFSDQQFIYILPATKPSLSGPVRAVSSDRFSSSQTAEVDRLTCFPLVKLGATHKSGIRWIPASFTGKYQHELGTPAQSISLWVNHANCHFDNWKLDPLCTLPPSWDV